jgi:carbon-monoxide dehydrogenase medium subunit
LEKDSILIPRSFEYSAPESLTEAISLLKEHGESQSKVFAGGQSLLALMKLRLASPNYLVDIKKIPGLSYIQEQNGWFKIGATTTHDAVATSLPVRKKLRVLAEAAGRIGDQQIRNRGTIGGSVCHADPAADIPPALLVLEAEFVAVGPEGERVIHANDFFLDFFTTSLQPDEILTEIRIPPLKSGTGSVYLKHIRREGEFAIVGVAAILSIDAKKSVDDVRVALGAVGSTPVRATTTEKLLQGKPATEENLTSAAEKAATETNPGSDTHGTAEYRSGMAKVFTKRALGLCLQRIAGGLTD